MGLVGILCRLQAGRLRSDEGPMWQATTDWLERWLPVELRHGGSEEARQARMVAWMTAGLAPT